MRPNAAFAHVFTGNSGLRPGRLQASVHVHELFGENKVGFCPPEAFSVSRLHQGHMACNAQHAAVQRSSFEALLAMHCGQLRCTCHSTCAGC